jgi:hypothetical protein
MKISIKGFIYHKTAEKYSDCFDRYGYNKMTNKFAISDGVSKSFFPDVWAELLVDFFIKNEDKINISDIDSYKLIQNEWFKKVSEIVNKPNQKYFVKNFFIQGRPAAATFAGLHFFKENRVFRWEAVALGDSFLFFVPEDLKNINSDFDKVVFLSSKKDFEFNNFPDFFDSRSIIHKGKIKHKTSILTSGTFYLMTDALSEWFISQKQDAIDKISEWNTQSDFENDVTNLRKSSLQNDDSAVLIIKVNENATDEFDYNDILVTDFRQLIEKEQGDASRALHSETTDQFEVRIDEKNETPQIVDQLNGDENKINNSEKNEVKNSSDIANDDDVSKEEIAKVNVRPDPIEKSNEQFYDIHLIDKRKHSLWEYLFHNYWGGLDDYMIRNAILESKIKEEGLRKTVNSVAKNIDAGGTKDSNASDTSDTKDSDTSDNKDSNASDTKDSNALKVENKVRTDIPNELNEVNKKYITKKQNKKNKKKSSKESNSDEDISSITDKF